MSFYRFVKLSKLEPNLEVFAEYLISRLDNNAPVLYYDSHPFYYYFQSGVHEFQYGEYKCSIRTSKVFEIDPTKQVLVHFSIANQPRRWFEVNFESETVEMTGVDGDMFIVPFNLLNEIDFFQYEILNPDLPMKTSVLLGLINKIIKEYK